MNTGRCALAVAAVISVYFVVGLPGCGGGLGGANPSDGGGESGDDATVDAMSDSGSGLGPDGGAMSNETGPDGLDAHASGDTTQPNTDSDGGPTDAGAGEPALADCATPARSDAPAGIPEAYIYAQLGPETTGAQQCGFSSDQLLFQIGASTSPLPVVKAGGSTQNGEAVAVACNVDATCSGFDLSLYASLGGAGDVSFVGHIGPHGGSGISGTFSGLGYAFADPDCTITLAYNGAPLPAGGSPGPGRIWGHIDCPNATEPGDAGQPARTCDGFADFLFENCL